MQEDLYLTSTITICDASNSSSDLLRHFTADFNTWDDEEKLTSVGKLKGWIGWNIFGTDIFDDADSISSDAARLGYVASQLVEQYEEQEGDLVEDVVLLDRAFLEPDYRGQRALPEMLATLMRLLRLDSTTGVLLTQPEPQQEEGGPYPDGPVRDRAMKGLVRTLEEAGFVRYSAEIWWARTDTWTEESRN